MKSTSDTPDGLSPASSRSWASRFRGGLGCAALIALALSSCTPCQSLSIAAAGALVGSQVVKDPKTGEVLRTVGVLTGAAAVYTCYQAAPNQRAYAENRGRKISKTYQRTSTSRKGSNLKAIPVPKPSTPVSKNQHGVPPEGTRTQEYMIWDASKDKLFSNETYQMPADQNYVEIDGKRADVVRG